MPKITIIRYKFGIFEVERQVKSWQRISGITNFLKRLYGFWEERNFKGKVVKNTSTEIIVKYPKFVTLKYIIDYEKV